MNELPLFFIAPDPHMSLGFSDIFTNFHLICHNRTPAVDLMLDQGIPIFCAERELDFPPPTTKRILQTEACKKFIREHVGNSDFEFLFFRLNYDPTAIISELELPGQCMILNVSSDLSLGFESKLNLAENLPSLLGQFSILRIEFLEHENLVHKFGPKYVVQTSLGWAGNGTWFVNSESELNELKALLPESQLVKVSPFYEGDTYTFNACLFFDGLWVSQPFFQLTGTPALTQLPGSTVGNVWRDMPDQDVHDLLINFVKSVGDRLGSEEYRGIFGVDIMLSDGMPVLIEVNSRITASVSMMSQLQSLKGEEAIISLHRRAILGDSFPGQSQAILEGAQIVRRSPVEREYVQYTVCGYVPSSGDTSNVIPHYLLKDTTSDEVLILPNSQKQKIGEEILRVQSKNPSSLVTLNMELTQSALKIIEGSK